MAPDAMGHAYLDYLEGRSPILTIERSDGYLDWDNMESYFCDYSEFPECEKKALEYAKGRVLDIGSGAGRVALYLQKRSMNVTAIDLSELALDVARARGVKNLVAMSACNLEFEDNSFDTAVAFGNNFGLCGSPEGVVSMLVRLRSILADEGVILAETVDPLKTDKEDHLMYHELNRKQGKSPGQIRLRLKYRGLATNWWDLLLVTPEEMTILCDKSGWKIKEIFQEGGKSPVYAAVLSKA